MIHPELKSAESQAAMTVRPARRGPRTGWALGGAAALLFAVATTQTVLMPRTMPSGMAMPGGWTMSMAWMRMPGQGWASATLTFIGMWITMMVAMMLPAQLPSLRHYYADVGARENTNSASLTVVVATAYFFVWTCAGIAIYPAGAGLALLLMQSPELSRLLPVAAVRLLSLRRQFSLRHGKCRGCAAVEAPLRYQIMRTRRLLFGVDFGSARIAYPAAGL